MGEHPPGLTVPQSILWVVFSLSWQALTFGWGWVKACQLPSLRLENSEVEMRAVFPLHKKKTIDKEKLTSFDQPHSTVKACQDRLGCFVVYPSHNTTQSRDCRSVYHLGLVRLVEWRTKQLVLLALLTERRRSWKLEWRVWREGWTSLRWVIGCFIL